MTANEDIFDGAIRRLIGVERYKAGEVRKILALLDAANRDLVEQIKDRLERIGRGQVLSRDENERLQALIVLIKAEREAAAASMFEATQSDMFEFAEDEADFKALLIEGSAGVELNRPNISQLRAVVASRPFQGRLLREWYADLAADQRKQIVAALRIGIAEGQTTDQIVRRIRGTRAAQYRDGVLEIGRRQAQTIVRTAIAHVANAASEQVYIENDDVIEGVQWVSTLDSRTTTLCASRDGKVYPIGQGPRPPAHMNCRSTTVPYLGAPTGKRASMFGQVPASQTYEQWLRRQPVAFQEEVLGKGKADLFRKGGLSLEKFIDPTGREYTVKELRSRIA